MQAKQEKPMLSDAEIEQATGGIITQRRLQKDRITDQHFPFYRVGRLCFYKLEEVYAVIEKSRFGGEAARAKAAA